MPDIHSTIIYTLIFISILAVIFVGGRYVRKIPSDISKRINQISFAVAIGSGILLYLLHHAVFMYIFLVSLVAFFMFFNYEEKK